MPERLDKCVEELKRKGYSESQAWAICTSIVRINNSLDNCPGANRIVEEDLENED
jgi:hypothetical protein